MIYPLILMIVLSILVTLRLIFIAIRLVITRKVHIKQFRLFDGDIPKHALAARAHFKNMFEIPILFYLLCLLNIFFNNYNQLDIIFCWCFVGFRVIHFFIRLKNQKTINIIPRTLVFIVSLIFLTIGWISFLFNSFVI